MNAASLGHVLFIHGGALGDFVLALRAVAALRRAGATRITLLGRPAVATIARRADLVDDVLDLESGGFHALFTEDGPLPRPIRSVLRGVDHCVDMLGGAAVAARLRELGLRRIWSVDPRPRPNWSGHITDQWFHDLAAQGLALAGEHPGIRFPNAARESEELIVFHPGSGGNAKCWPIERFVALANRLRAAGRPTLFLLGPVESERWDVSRRRSLERAGPIRAGLSIYELAEVIVAASSYVGNDSGVTHLAAALGVPTIAVFSPTDPTVWGPLGRCVRIVGGRSRPGWPEVDEVLDAVWQSIAEINVDPMGARQAGGGSRSA